MGVADSPDLANLYGWFCERRDNVLSHPSIAFYGRYIDDCIGIVYATTEQEALHIMQSTVRIDDCVLTWDVGKFQPFLDMMLYIDINNRLQHMPYMKAKSHQERIPWISAHPLDVKRGTFYGEMSRLATLSSTPENYSEAISRLVALYIKRGYPEALVKSWMKAKYTERWDKRLTPRVEDEGGVLVLKSNFNTAWNFFSASTLGNTMLDYMRFWLYKAERMEFSKEFPPVPYGWTDDVESSRHVIKTLDVLDTEVLVQDIRRTDILDRRTIVSRKRTFNLFDITSLFKRIVLEKQGEGETQPETILQYPEPQAQLPPSVPDAGIIVKRRKDGKILDLDDESFHVHRRSPSPMWVDPDLALATGSNVGRF